jgi:hypothetical protein
MVESPYIYALCRQYHKVKNESEREIVVGIEKGAFATSTFNLFKSRKGDYVARFEEISRARGCVIGKITDSRNKWQAMRTIPIDDLVDDSEICSGVK